MPCAPGVVHLEDPGFHGVSEAMRPETQALVIALGRASEQQRPLFGHELSSTAIAPGARITERTDPGRLTHGATKLDLIGSVIGASSTDLDPSTITPHDVRAIDNATTIDLATEPTNDLRTPLGPARAT
jgi:hypothetical protein